MIEFISSVFGASMNAKPFDSCVSGLRMTLIASATRFSACSQPMISSAVTQVARLPKKTVKLIQRLPLLLVGIALERRSSIEGSYRVSQKSNAPGDPFGYVAGTKGIRGVHQNLVRTEWLQAGDVAVVTIPI